MIKYEWVSIMKKLFRILLISLSFSFLFLFSGCSLTLSSEDAITNVEGYDISFNDNYEIIINAEDETSLDNVLLSLSVSEGATYEVYRNEALTRLATDFELLRGYNVFYVKVTAQNKKDSNVYTLNVYRNEIFSVTHNTVPGFTISTTTNSNIPTSLNVGEDLSFKVVADSTHSSNFDVYVNGSKITKMNGIYTISNVHSDLDITIENVSRLGYGENTLERKSMIHALGEIGGMNYLNCYECFLNAYENGAKYFEIDLRFSTDNRLIATHMFENIGGSNVSYEEYQNKLIEGSYHGVTIEDLINILKTYDDVFFIIDTKEINKESVIQSIVNEFEDHDSSVLLERIIPYLYKIDQYTSFENIYNFKEYIYTPYQNYLSWASSDSKEDIIYFLQTHVKVLSVAVNYDMQWLTGYNEEFFADVVATGAMLYVFTIDDKSDYLVAMNDYDATGVITNTITPYRITNW